MSDLYRQLIADTVLEKTGVAIKVAEPRIQGVRSSLVATFEGLTSQQGPRFSIQTHGLKSHRVRVAMGDYSSPCIRQMQLAGPESLTVARSFLGQIASIAGNALTLSPEQNPEEWCVGDSGFEIEVTTRVDGDQYSDQAFAATAANVMAPLIAAVGELIGYEDVNETESEEQKTLFDEEGLLTSAVIRKRERSRRNRMLCLLIHGYTCGVCRSTPESDYPGLKNIIEVHHIEPVSTLSAPRIYDPRTDLIPLCPNCHRAIHTRVPAYLPEELRKIMKNSA